MSHLYLSAFSGHQANRLPTCHATPVFFSDSDILAQLRKETRESGMGSLLSSPMKREDIDMALARAKHMVESNPVVVFSKTYCGYCTRVKQLFSQLNVTHKVIELDEESDGDEIQRGLMEWTGQRTVPNVFVGSKHIGGCDVVLAKYQQGSLEPLLAQAGAIPKLTAQT